MGWCARNGLCIAGCVAVLGAATAGPASAATDEDQVRAALNGMNGSYNSTDFRGFASHLCAGMLKVAGLEASWYASRKSDGPTQITINSVEVADVGDIQRAVANVRFEAANHADTKTLDVDFLREGTEWKACRYDVGRYI